MLVTSNHTERSPQLNYFVNQIVYQFFIEVPVKKTCSPSDIPAQRDFYSPSLAAVRSHDELLTVKIKTNWKQIDVSVGNQVLLDSEELEMEYHWTLYYSQHLCFAFTTFSSFRVSVKTLTTSDILCFDSWRVWLTLVLRACPKVEPQTAMGPAIFPLCCDHLTSALQEILQSLSQFTSDAEVA